MARTRNASANFNDGGVLLGKGGVPISQIPGQPLTPQAYADRTPLDRQGNPISPQVANLRPVRSLGGGVVLHGPGAEPVPVAPPVVSYRADRSTWSRNMEAYDLAMLLDYAFSNPGTLGEGLVVEVSEAEFATMKGDLRRHFMPVRRVVVELDDPE